MTEDDWIKKFKPIKNPNGNRGFDGEAFETHGVDVTFVKEQPNCYVWTLVGDGTGPGVIVEGMHYVNRICYFITQVPWESGVPMEITL